jgi:hypothetical protein
MRTEKKNLKAEQLKHWQAMPDNQNPLDEMEAIPYKARGSRYGACGIRVDGNPRFVDAVLSRLKPLLAGENDETRLELARHKVDGSGIGKRLDNTATDAEVCYIRLHERGGEAKITNAIIRSAARRSAARVAIRQESLILN